MTGRPIRIFVYGLFFGLPCAVLAITVLLCDWGSQHGFPSVDSCMIPLGTIALIAEGLTSLLALSIFFGGIPVLLTVGIIYYLTELIAKKLDR